MKKVHLEKSISLAAVVVIGFSPMLVSAQNNQYQLNSKFRFIHFDRDFGNDDNDRDQSALGVEFNYLSPTLINNSLRVGLSSYNVAKLGAGGRLRADILDSDASSFGLLGQAFLEFKLTQGTAIKLGRQKHKSMLLISSGTRAIPNTFQGINIKQAIAKNLSVYGAVYNEWSSRTSPDFTGFMTDANREEGSIDYIGLLGAKWKTGAFSINTEYLVSKDYLAKFGLRASYTNKLASDSKLRTTLGYFTSDDDGDLFVADAEAGDLDSGDDSNNGEGAYVEVAWSKQATTWSFAIAKFDDAWIEDNFRGDHGRNPFPTRAIAPDLTNANETVTHLKVAHKFGGALTGLSGHIAIGRGKDAENSVLGAAGGVADEDWKELKLTYQFPKTKGLKFTGIYHDYNSDEIGTVAGVKDDDRDIRLYLDYNYNFK